MNPNICFQSLALLALLPSTLAAQEIPITTTSEEARALYIQARELAERYRTTEPKRLLEQTIAKDSNFALAYHALALFQPTNKDGRTYVSKALLLSEKASQGEQLWIQITQANLDGDEAKRKQVTEQLLKLYPNDKRVQEAMGIFFHFSRNEAEKGIPFYKKAIELDPAHHSAYNSLGYAYASLGSYDEAEKVLKKYTELLPNESNPHDSYAEILMKQGKFIESITEYNKSLALDPTFSISYLGLGTDYVFTGKANEGRKQFEKLYAIAADDNERIQAIDATAKSYLIEGRYARAILEQKKRYALLEKQKRVVNMFWNQMQTVELFVEAGKSKEANDEFQRGLTVTSDPAFPAKQKDRALRYIPYAEGRIALEQNNLSAAKKDLQLYRSLADSVQSMPAIKLAHQFAGRIALREKRYDNALTELQQADQRNAQTLFITAQVCAAKGDKAKAKEFFSKAANFNDLSWEYALVRKKAKEELAKLK